MPKSNFLLVDLNEEKTKKLAETITSETSRKILNHLAEKDDSEANIAKELALPISTVHYHLQKLTEANLVVVEEFHYSRKGREVNHYKLANKYIIIAPKKVSGLKQALKNILPVGLLIFGISAVIKVLQKFSLGTEASAGEIAAGEMLKASARNVADQAVQEAAPLLAEVPLSGNAPAPDIALWFLLGGLAALGIYLLFVVVKERIRKS
ncbi:MAG: helix-turn-helix domain-containing protein [Nanoarchaeota archaeon]